MKTMPTNAALYYYILRRFPCMLSGPELDKYVQELAQNKEIWDKAIEDMIYEDNK